MKHCKHCNIDYPDNVNYCTECGRTLLYEFEKQDPVPFNLEKKPNVKKGMSIWKAILIVLAALIMGLFLLINYSMNAATYLRVEPNILVADKSGGETVVDIDYDGYVWVINHIPDWIEVEEYEQSFMVRAGNNLTGYDREGSITVQSGDFLAQVIIQQKGSASYIKVSESSIHFDEDGGRKNVSIKTDGCNYTVEYPDFLSVSTEDDKIKIRAYSNHDEYRSGYVTISEDNVRTNIYITQGGTCNRCHGSGYSSCVQGGWGYGMYYSQCWLCHGTGTLQCSTCGGRGKRE